MKLYEYQRARSFIDLDASHSSAPIFSNFISSIIARPTEAMFYVALPWDGGMEVSSNGLGQMSVMAIYGKNL